MAAAAVTTRARAYFAQALADLAIGTKLGAASDAAAAVAHAHAAAELVAKAAVLRLASLGEPIYSHYPLRLLRTRARPVWRALAASLRARLARLEDVYPTRRERRNFRYPFPPPPTHPTAPLPSGFLTPAASFTLAEAREALGTARALVEVVRRMLPDLVGP